MSPTKYQRSDTEIGIALLVHLASPGSRDEVSDVFKLGVAALLDGDNLHRDLVLEHTGSIVQRAEDVHGVAFGRRDDFILDILVDGAAMAGLENKCILYLYLRSTVHMKRVPCFIMQVRINCQVRSYNVPILAP